MFLAVLWRADKHLDQIVVQAIKDLPLEGPLELRVIEIARVQLEVVSVNCRIGEAGPDYYFNGIAFGTSVKLDQRMLVEPQLVLHARQAVGSHLAIVADMLYSYRSASMGSRREALIAGNIPLIRPTKTRMIVATRTIVGSIISRMSAASAFFATAL